VAGWQGAAGDCPDEKARKSLYFIAVFLRQYEAG
jgi:hypothetical protein